MKALLTSRSGVKRRLNVVIHAPVRSLNLTGCGRAFEEMRAQDFLVHQTALSADLSDVDCPQCLAVMAPNSRIYPQACTSAFCGKSSASCPGCPSFGAQREFRAWRELRRATRPDEVWCPNFWRTDDVRRGSTSDSGPDAGVRAHPGGQLDAADTHTARRPYQARVAPDSGQLNRAERFCKHFDEEFGGDDPLIDKKSRSPR